MGCPYIANPNVGPLTVKGTRLLIPGINSIFYVCKYFVVSPAKSNILFKKVFSMIKNFR